MEKVKIRIAETEDCQSILAIYQYYVLNTAITFEYDVPSVEEMLNRMRNIQTKYPYLIAEFDGNIVAYAYASDFRHRAAYQWSPESTVYIHKDCTGKGIGKMIYKQLFDILKLQGFLNVFGCVALPNPASVALHLKMGFTDVGSFQNIGYKHGQWHSTQWFQLKLNEYQINPTLPKRISEVEIRL
ncbi:MAG: N-acetyltransferase [Saprospiraceae bacterium]|nr:N-acetyltransferase [Saprospiraceae bacterium]